MSDNTPITDIAGGGMSVNGDSLGTRIATVLYTRAMSRLSWHRNWDDLQPEVQQMWLDDADAVIRELQLTQQYLVDGIVSDDVPRPWEVPCETRWTTEWERFDEVQ